MASGVRQKKHHSALKHGGYSALGVLPGESRTEFEQHRKRLIGDLAPKGPLEDDIVSTLARLLWRKQNRSTFRTVAFAKARLNEIINDEIARRKIPPPPLALPIATESAEVQVAREEATRAGAEQAQKEFGELYELTSVDVATDAHLLEELAIEERLDALIEKCLKRLLMVRGVKSMVLSGSEPAQIPKSQDVSRRRDASLGLPQR
jgi:hypothetical protein